MNVDGAVKLMAKETILVVEDEEDIRKLLTYNLEKEGYQVFGVATGEEALQAVRGRLPKYREWCRAVYGDKGQASLRDAQPSARQRTAPASGRASLRAWTPIPAMVRLP